MLTFPKKNDYRQIAQTPSPPSIYPPPFIIFPYFKRPACTNGSGKTARAILHEDSLFWKAYNECDTTQFRQFFTEDVEFYHDKGGLTLGRENLIAITRKNLCSNENFRLRRETVAGSGQVFPLESGGSIYGAILSGEHFFYIYFMHYNNKTFRPVANTENGEVSSDTVFHYRQNGNIVTAEYAGGSIARGHLIALVDDNGCLDMRYHQVNDKGELHTGICRSTPEILPDGRIRLHETWQWTSGDGSSGTSVIEEVVGSRTT